MRRILVIGASGQVGKCLLRELAGREVVGTGHARVAPGLRKLDLADGAAVRALIRELRPEGILLPGGVTAVDWCEANEPLARKICVDGTRAVCEAASELGAQVVHFGTDYIYSGAHGPRREQDPPDPVSAYGRVKAEAEAAATVGVLLRTSMVYSDDPDSGNFHNFLVRTLRAGKAAKVYVDQSGNPTWAPALAKAAVEALDRRLAGIWNVAGPEVLTRVEMARRIVAAYGLDPALLQPVTSAEFVLPARRPSTGGLVLDKARAGLRSPLVPVAEALAAMAGKPA